MIWLGTKAKPYIFLIDFTEKTIMANFLGKMKKLGSVEVKMTKGEDL